MNKLFEALTSLAGAIAGLTLLAMWRGYVLSVLWAWFVVSTFAVPMLNIPAAIGLFLTVALFKSAQKENTNDVARTTAETLGIGAMGPLFLLGIGWIVTKFM